MKSDMIKLLKFSLIPIFSAYYQSSVTNLTYWHYLKNTPWYIYIIFSIPLILAVIIVLIKSKMEEGVSSIWVGGGDYILKWRYSYGDLCWDIKVLSNYYNSPLYEIINHFTVARTPRCPKCGTKLEFVKHQLWYTWNCADCTFKYRTLKSHDKLHKRVKYSFERKLERKIEEKYK